MSSATAVKLAQRGGRGLLRGNKLFPLTNVAIRENCNLEEKTFAVRHIKTKRDRQCEIWEKEIVNWYHVQKGGQRSQAESVANLPDNSDKFSEKSQRGFPCAD